jgi:membrane fusion protein (multidrug efflux system)
LDDVRHHQRAPSTDRPTSERSSPGSRGEALERTDRPPEAPRRDDAEGGDRHQDEKGRHRRWPLIALAVGVVIAAIGGTLWWYLTKDQESTDDAYTDGRAVMIAPHVAGYATTLAVTDNQFVHKGDLLVEIERRDLVAVRDQAIGRLAVAKAQLDSARVALEKQRTTAPAQLAQAQGQLQQVRGQLYQAEREFRRQHSIDRAATSEQSIDASTASLQSVQGQVQQAEAQVRQANLVPQDIAQAEAQVQQLEGQVKQEQANLDQAEINLDYTRIVAPQDGWVTKRNVEVGNYLQSGSQIMAIVTPEVWVTANFKETQLDRMRVNQKVRIRVDSYPGLRLEGHVDSLQFGSGTKFTAFPPENATGNFVKIVQRVPVKIVIDRGLDPHRPLPLGISVEPTVLLE